MENFIYHFGPKGADGSARDVRLLGGKGANLAEMSRLGLPVPPGFTLSTALYHRFRQNGARLPEEIKPSIRTAVGVLEGMTGKAFGGAGDPLLVSVRSGAPESMPGMMDTILNLGLNEKSTEILGCLCRDGRFAWDSYRRFVQMYSSVVMGMNSSLLDVYLEDYKSQNNRPLDSRISVEEWRAIVSHFKEAILQKTGLLFPEDPWEQLWRAISSVFKSWNSMRARAYREMKSLSEDLGTAVNIQAMVFGNRGESSATGVLFTRNPSTGAKSLFGEFLLNAQGEDVVAGVRTPALIVSEDPNKEDMRRLLPEAFSRLEALSNKLERHYKFAQDIEFTVERNKLYLLQTRDAKCSPKAHLKILFDLMNEGLLTEQEVLKKVDPLSLISLLHPTLDGARAGSPVARGLPASPGGAVGRIVFDSDTAQERGQKGLPVILARMETSPEDIQGMIHAKGILTLRGGMTSHAAVVARSMGRPCVVGCESARIDETERKLYLGEHVLSEGDTVSLNGATGDIFLGCMKTKAPDWDENFFRLLALADKYARVKVRANAETPADVKKAKQLGAVGLGLCRTEHMFFAPERVNIMRRMILSTRREEREQSLKELFALQEEDFYEILNIMSPHPVTVRLLDPPLHEFLPQNEEDIIRLAQKTQWQLEELKAKIRHLKETNPMLGHRGCRLALSFPEIYLMQVRALSAAVARLIKERREARVEIMIPFVCLEGELRILKDLILSCVKKAEKEFALKLPLKFGAMLELPRACLQAGRLAKIGDFFSFGTNDLTQTVFGFSRDDSGKFLPSYRKQKILPEDPFLRIDREGVGELMKTAVQRGRSARPDIKIGLCGEQGGDPESLKFFHSLALDYVSCSPYRAPIARLALAQAALEEEAESRKGAKKPFSRPASS